jgi:hypothetical protein
MMKIGRHNVNIFSHPQRPQYTLTRHVRQQRRNVGILERCCAQVERRVRLCQAVAELCIHTNRMGKEDMNCHKTENRVPSG